MTPDQYSFSSNMLTRRSDLSDIPQNLYQWVGPEIKILLSDNFPAIYLSPTPTIRYCWLHTLPESERFLFTMVKT